MHNLTKQIAAWTIIINIVLLGVLYDFVSTIYRVKEYPSHVHMTLYLDRTFDEFEQEAIIEAALEWSVTTNHIVDYDIIQMPTNKDIDVDNSIIIYKVTPDHPTVIALDIENENGTLGYCDSKTIIPSIGLVNQRIENVDYKPTVMHELDHSLGLGHNKKLEDFDTLMYPGRYLKVGDLIMLAGSEHITKKDGANFCKLYRCDPTKLQYQEEPLHL